MPLQLDLMAEVNVAQELQCEHFYLRSLSTFKAVYALPRVYLSSYVCRCPLPLLSLPLLCPFLVTWVRRLILAITSRHALYFLFWNVLVPCCCLLPRPTPPPPPPPRATPFVFFSSAATKTTTTSVAAQCPLLELGHQHHHFTSRSHFSYSALLLAGFGVTCAQFICPVLGCFAWVFVLLRVFRFT